MKRACTILLHLLFLSLLSSNVSAQFIVAQDTIRGRIDFCSRPGDLSNKIEIPNDSVFYMYPIDLQIDPWRYVDYYIGPEKTKSGYIKGRELMRIDDYDMVEVERLSAHGSISFRDENVKVNISVAPINPKDKSVKPNPNGKGYLVNGKPAKGTTKREAPKLRYSSMSASVKGRTITFPRNVYDYLLEPEIDNMAVYHNKKKDIVYIRANNGGTVAPYSVLWAAYPNGKVKVFIFDITTK